MTFNLRRMAAMHRMSVAGAVMLAASVLGGGQALAWPYTLSAAPGGLQSNGAEDFTAVIGSTNSSGSGWGSVSGWGSGSAWGWGSGSGGGTSYSGSAGELSLDVRNNSTGVTSMVQAWCFDIKDILKLPADFYGQTLTTAVTSASTLNIVNALLVNGQALATNNAMASAALQYAIWEAEYETGGTYDVTSGAFKITKSGGGSSVEALANSFLGDVASGAWKANSNYSIYEYYAAGNQSLITLVPPSGGGGGGTDCGGNGGGGTTPVPEPGTLALIGAGLAGLGLIRRSAR